MTDPLRFEILGSKPSDYLDVYLAAWPAYRDMLAPFWKQLAGATLTVAETLSPGAIGMTMTDAVTDEEALAYHSLANGAAYGLVERAMCDKYKLPYGPELIHEVVEAAVDPLLNYTRWELMPGDILPSRILYEVMDPVAYHGTVKVNGVVFPNATLPAYWQGQGAMPPYDLARLVQQPLPAIPPGGAVERSDGGMIYGTALIPELRDYLASKHGRRWWRKARAGLSAPVV